MLGKSVTKFERLKIRLSFTKIGFHRLGHIYTPVWYAPTV